MCQQMFDRCSIDFRQIFDRFSIDIRQSLVSIDFQQILDRSTIDFRQIFDRFSIDVRSIFDRFSIDVRQMFDGGGGFGDDWRMIEGVWRALKLADNSEKLRFTFFASLHPYFDISGSLTYAKRQILTSSIVWYQKLLISPRAARYPKINRKPIQNLSKIYRKSIEHLFKTYRKSIENLA